MTGDGHSKDARMLTEVTESVNRWSDFDLCPTLAHLLPVWLDL
jgi:hypothetical protein